MDENLKFVLSIILSIGSIIIIFALGISVPVSYYFDKQEFNHQIKCKEIGGSYIYESNKWICK